MSRTGAAALDRRWLLAGAAGLILFLLIQVFPIRGQIFANDAGPVLDRAQAERRAAEWADSAFGLPAGELAELTVTYLSDRDTIAYLGREQRLGEYKSRWQAAYPADVYRVDAELADGSHLTLGLHLESGALVYWRHEPAGGRAAADRPDALPEGREAAARALAWAAQWGVRPGEWAYRPDLGPADGGGYRYESRQPGIGEARLRLTVTPPAGWDPASGDRADGDGAADGWRGGRVTYDVALPGHFTEYLERQERLGTRWSTIGFLMPQAVLLVLAVVYAGLYGGRWSSFRRGALLACLFFGLYAGFTMNLWSGFRAEAIASGLPTGDAAVLAVVLVQLFFLTAMALLTYFGAVGGDGLWRSMGYSLWPRWREPGFGADVLRSMRQGYVLAAILLGAQSAVLLGLEELTGAFATTDAAQSTYNMAWPWLLPLLAWCAGISEEIQSRLFAAGLFRRWLTAGAQAALGREPSRRASAALTVLAFVPANIIWAFGHVGYAIYPISTRLIELTILGMLFGWFLLRFGLMAVLFAHVALDAALMGVQLMFDGLSGDLWAGVFSFLMPALVGWAIGRLHRLRYG